MTNIRKITRVIIVILSVCLTFSFTNLASSSKNSKTVISLYKSHAEDNSSFNCSNMFPGDSETKSFTVNVSYTGTVSVKFSAVVRPGFEKMAEVLKCKVVLQGDSTPLYDGLLRDMPESLDKQISSQRGTTTELVYVITAYLDTSVGNEYMNCELTADLYWWVNTNDTFDDTEPDVTDPDVTEPDDTDPDDEFGVQHGGQLIYPPQTSDNSHFYLWLLTSILSLVVIIVILSSKHRTERNDKEKK